MAKYAVDMRHITKKFPLVLANDDVNFIVQQGEIHALVGENGAGKTALLNAFKWVLYGEVTSGIQLKECSQLERE